MDNDPKVFEKYSGLGQQTISNINPVPQTPNVTPPPTVPPQNFQASQPHFPNNNKHLVYVISFLFLAVVASGVIYALVKKVSLFSSGSQYTEANFTSAMLAKVSSIDSASYSVSASLKVNPRESGAKPFEVKNSNSKELEEQYKNDYKRSTDAQAIIASLKFYAGESSYGTKTVKSYPNNIDSVMSGTNGYVTYSGTSIYDPKTGEKYKYRVTEGGKNFELTMSFETSNAISRVKDTIKSYSGITYSTYYPGVATSTKFSGNTVTFSKNSPSYVYLSATPPKPFLVTVSESLRMLSNDVDGSLSVSASSNSKGSDSTDWKFNFNAEGTFGDLSYKVNADAIKIDSDYYFKINNIPSLFMSDISFIKGKWVKVPAVSDSKDGAYYSSVGYLAESIPKYEKEYKENKESTVRLLRKVTEVADDTKIILYKEKPTTEKVGSEKLTKYVVGLRKDAILSFYTNLIEAVKDDKEIMTDYENILDDGLLDYLKSDEFSDVFDYVDQNTKISMWVNADGYPVKVEQNFRIVPPDTAVQLKDNQINVIFTIDLSDINKNVDINAPKDAKLLEDVMKEVSKNDPYASARTSGERAALKSYINSVRAYAELVYDKTPGGGYGKKAFALGSCKQTADTLFGDKDVFANINSATKSSPSKATCASVMKNGKVNDWALSVPYPDDSTLSWCVDSTGNSKEITGKIKGASCN
jgi:hypothetical protein